MKRHSTDVVSLIFGLLFVAVAAWWAASYYLNWALNWNVPNFGWIAAGALIVLGLIGVVASVRRDRPEPALADGPPDAPLSTDPSWPAESSAASTASDAASTTADLGEPATAPTDATRDDRG
jgi:hypothetical protein